MRRFLLWSVFLLVALHQGCEWHAHRPLARAPGIIAASEPHQEMLANAPVMALDEFTLQPLASFAFEARVLLVKRYRFDQESALAPYDLGIGWGRMSDTAVIEQLGLAQSARFLTWRWRDAPPIPADEITRSATNVHVIPANAGVERQVAALRPGQRVRAKGLLVEASRPDGWRWRSSLSREDGGRGACELMYLADLTLLD
jgi:hypothetical protein